MDRVPSEFMCQSPNPHCDGVWRWVFGGSLRFSEVMKVLETGLVAPRLLPAALPGFWADLGRTHLSALSRVGGRDQPKPDPCRTGPYPPVLLHPGQRVPDPQSWMSTGQPHPLSQGFSMHYRDHCFKGRLLCAHTMEYILTETRKKSDCFPGTGKPSWAQVGFPAALPSLPIVGETRLSIKLKAG